ncbi:hypothetical protein ACOMHN_024518 [Nucella lapillus]
MECIMLCCVLFAISLSIQVQHVVSSPQENRSLYPDPTALFNSGKPPMMGAWLLLKDYMTQGDTLLKERLKEFYSNLKEQLKEGDSVLKERMEEGVAQVKEQLKEGDGRLKEQLGEDVAWLKDEVARGQTRMKEELAEEEAKTKEELAEQTEALNKLKHSVKEQLKSSSALIDDMKQQMADFQAELKSTTLQLHTTQTELRTTQETLQSTQETLQSTQETLQSTQEALQSTLTDLHTTQDRVKNTEEELQKTRQQLQNEAVASAALKNQQQSTQDEVHSLRVKFNDLESRLQQSVQESSDMEEFGVCAVVSTFIRWGRTGCPYNTSIVYSGVVGGQSHVHSGGGSNYLCLVMDPQLDNMTLPSYDNHLYGTEYEHVDGHHNHDVVCSVCRAPQATTLMIPATLTCPLGWTTQYRGHLVSDKFDHKGRTEYVCLDEDRENSHGGHEDKNGALIYYVTTQCGSLPCPPYVHNKVVTCVVCSM